VAVLLVDILLTCPYHLTHYCVYVDTVLSLVKNVLQPNVEETSDAASVTAAVNTTNKTDVARDDDDDDDNITSSSSDASDVKPMTEPDDENAEACQEDTR